MKRRLGYEGWLDNLARRAVRSEPSSTERAAAAVTVVPGGTTRRTALRRVAGAAGAVALTGSLTLAEPPLADAETPLELCIKESFRSVYGDFVKCVETPLDDLESLNGVLEVLEKGSLGKNPKKAKRTIANYRRRRDKALKEVLFCERLLTQERAEGEQQCQLKDSKPSPPPTGPESKTSPGCERGFTLCVDYCCNDANAYCQGCGTPKCCRLDADCCPGEH